MVDSILNNFTVNKQSPNPVGPSLATNYPVQAKPNAPQTDTVSLSNKQPMSKQKKTMLTLGGIATAVLGTVLAVKGYRSYQISKALKQIEQKFLKLQENMPEVQKTFNDVFLRTDITEKEALEILNRYKEVEKIAVTGTKEEYIQAIFNEAKRNFGFNDSKFKLVLKNGEVSENGKTLGGAAHLANRVEIDPSQRLELIQGVMHHEMRHMKQNFYMVNYDSQAYKLTLKNEYSEKLSKKELEEVLDSCLEDMREAFNLKCFDRNNIPKENIQYAKECLEGRKTYVDGHTDFNSYYNNFLEVDARQAGGLIDKLFNSKILGGNK